MRKQVLLQLIVICLFIDCVIAQESVSRVAYKILDNFDTGEVYTWEPYPYAQDVGYDPYFRTKKEPAFGGKGESLSRITKPNDAIDLSQGFTKRIDLYTIGSSRLKFAYYFMTDRQPEKLDVQLGTFDGKLFTHTLKSPKANSWVEVDLPLDAFTLNGKSLPANEHLQVVAIHAFYPLVTHLMSYTILMDDFSINGERSRQFVSQSPKSTWFEQFGHTVINQHYAPGETFSASFKVEGDLKLSEVTADLILPDGQVMVKKVKLYDDGTHGDAKSQDGVWSNSALYSFKKSDPAGQWKIKVSGSNTSGTVSSELRFIVEIARITANDHPRVFFRGKELADRMASNEPATAKKLLENFINSYKPSEINIDELKPPTLIAPESVTGGEYSSSNMGGWYNTQNALAKVITAEMWQFYLKGDKGAGEKAKAALLKMASLPTWNHPWMEANGNHTYYPGFYAATASGLGYDLLYQIMTEQERAKVRNAIMNNSIKPFYRDMVELNRMPSNNSNHIAVILSGVGLAAIAIMNDDPALPGLEPYMSGILGKTKLFIDRTVLPEGSYNEPYTYQEMAFRELVEALYSFEKNLGVDYTSTTYLKDYYQYALYATQNDRGKYQDLGDVSPTYTFLQQPSQWLVYKMKDPFMYNYVKPSWDSGKAYGGIIPYLWYTEGITPIKRETLPTSKHFVGKGNVVMRSGWDDSGSIMIYKAGPNSNHYHYDQGTILLTHNGDELLSDAGHSSGYYENLYYPSYYTQAIGHNVMLVDMHGESQAPGDFNNDIAALKKYPKMTSAFTSEISDAAEGDLTSVYKGVVSNYTRSLISTKGGPIFLYDKVSSPDRHSYNWIFHAEHTNGKSSITYDKERVTITRPRARLTMDILSPEKISSRIRNSDRAESFIALSSEKMNNANFLAVMTPEGVGSNGSFGNRAKAARIEGKGWIGAKVTEQYGDVYGFFRTSSDASPSIEGFKTNASRFTATLNNGKVSKAYFEGSDFEAYGLKVRSSQTLGFALALTGLETQVEINADKNSQLSLSVPSKPSQVWLNGTTLKGWKFDANSKTLSLQLPSGKSKISIK